MRRSWFAVAAAAAWLLLSAPPGRAMLPEDRKAVAAGLDALYRGDDEGAAKIFRDELALRPGDPALSLGAAIAAWWGLENEFAAPDSPEEKAFLEADERAIRDARLAADGDQNAEAYVCLGAAYGLRGRLEALRRHWLKAYRDGRRAYKDEEKALQLDPKLYDAYLGIGAFDYYAATLSRFVRLFMFGASPDKARGLAEIHLAEQGQFTGIAAKLLLVGLDWTFEKNPQDAWRILEEISARYPGSPTIASMRLIGLFNLRDADGLRREARTFLGNAEKGAPYYRPIDRAAGHYFLGMGEQLAGNYEEAIRQDREALRLLPEHHRTRGAPLLFIGECLDLLGRRDEAVESYRQALDEAPFWGVPRYAKFLLKHPFHKDANPLPSRRDELD